MQYDLPVQQVILTALAIDYVYDGQQQPVDSLFEVQMRLDQGESVTDHHHHRGVDDVKGGMNAIGLF